MMSSDSNTALEEALAENQELRDKQAKLLRRLSDQEKKSKRLQEQLVEKDKEVTQLYTELTASRGPSSGLSTGSFQTPPSSLSQLEQQDLPRSEGQNVLVLHLQKDNQSKGEEISKLKKEVTQLQRRLDYAEELEKQNTQLATAVSLYEDEKKNFQKQIEQLQHRIKPQPLHRDGVGIHTLQLECDTLKKEIADLQSQLELARQYETQYFEEVSENARLRENLAARKEELRGPVTCIDDIDVDETEKLKEALRGKELHIEHLKRQLDSYRKTATEFGELQQHSKKQSQQMMQLRSHIDASQVEKEERTEYERSLMKSLHSLEEDNEKLMKDYQAVSRDRAFIQESLRTLKKRHEELLSKLHQSEAQIGKSSQQDESVHMKWKSISDDYRAVCLKNQELLKENQQLEAENHQFVTNMKKLSNMGDENTDLQRRMITMRKEKEAIWDELQAAKAESQLYKEDFDHEREDRAKAHSQMADIRTECTIKLEETQRELQQVKADRDHHKQTLADVEAVNKRKEGELRSAVEEALAARQEVQAKTSQVKQYKKQVDSLKAQMAETERHNIDLIQEMEKVRTELVKAKTKTSKKEADKEEKKQNKKRSTEKVPTASPATSPMTQTPPGWENRVAELEGVNEQLRNDNNKLRHDNEAFCNEVQNLQKMNASLKVLVGQQHVERAHVPPHDFPPGAMMGAVVQQLPHPLPVTGHGQDQELIRRQLQQGFHQQQLQKQPYAEQRTPGEGELTILSSGPPSLSKAMHRQAPPPCARIQPPDFRVAQPHSFRSSIAPYSQARSPNSNPYPNRLPGSGASTLPVQVPGAKAFTDPQMTGKHRPMEGQFHASYTATD